MLLYFLLSSLCLSLLLSASLLIQSSLLQHQTRGRE